MKELPLEPAWPDGIDRLPRAARGRREWRGHAAPFAAHAGAVSIAGAWRTAPPGS